MPTKAWLIHSMTGSLNEKIHKFDQKDAAVNYVGSVITGRIPHTNVNKIYEVDVEAGIMTEMEVYLRDDLRLDFREKAGE